ncbi:MAG: hypothetical protein OXG92_15175 [Chloroflexi bacterium]|nr:hypothetical protein [Chloroflexota bacterium]MCY3582675.1 hypothetical protein [Chloroflexota bacterium]MCY3717790.1 hypothetical protein [Chloroflexota bacterium]MDE2651457.1 hypothetical protein [Chloroflexota bacterium]
MDAIRAESKADIAALAERINDLNDHRINAGRPAVARAYGILALW